MVFFSSKFYFLKSIMIKKHIRNILETLVNQSLNSKDPIYFLSKKKAKKTITIKFLFKWNHLTQNLTILVVGIMKIDNFLYHLKIHGLKINKINFQTKINFFCECRISHVFYNSVICLLIWYFFTIISNVISSNSAGKRI